MEKTYKLLGKEVTVNVNNLNQVTMDVEALEHIIQMANTAYNLGYAKVSRDEYVQRMEHQISVLKGGA